MGNAQKAQGQHLSKRGWMSEPAASGLEKGMGFYVRVFKQNAESTSSKATSEDELFHQHERRKKLYYEEKITNEPAHGKGG